MSDPVNETRRDRHPRTDARGHRRTPTRWPPPTEPVDESRRRGRRRRRPDEPTTPTPTTRDDDDGEDDEVGRPGRRERLEQEGEIAADYLEELLEIADLDGDLDMDVEGDRATVSIVGADLPQLVGDQGEVLEALQELTRLAVYRETGERSRLMLDVSGHRADRRTALEEQAAEIVAAGEGVRRAGRRSSRCRRSSARWCTTSSRPPA